MMHNIFCYIKYSHYRRNVRNGMQTNDMVFVITDCTRTQLENEILHKESIHTQTVIFCWLDRRGLA